MECLPYYRCKRPVTEEDKECGTSKVWNDELTKCVCKGKDVVEIDGMCSLICTPNSHPINTEECKCDNGYERDSDGVKCVSTDKPEECPSNSSKDMFGLECTCDDGYIRGADNRCTKLDCPDNSAPDIFDNAECKCKLGYVKSDDGKECFEDNGCVKNAKINLSTGDCECKDGFKKSTSNGKLSCIKPEEENEDTNGTVSDEDDEEEDSEEEDSEEEDGEEEDGDDEEDGGSGNGEDDIGFGELGEKVGDVAGGIKGSLMDSLTALGENAPTFSCSGTCFYVANLTEYGLGNVKFDFCFNVRNESKILWLLILAFLNFKMYFFIIRDLLKKI